MVYVVFEVLNLLKLVLTVLKTPEILRFIVFDEVLWVALVFLSALSSVEPD
jgi:hypothetical protein